MGTFGADTIDLADLEWSPTDSNNIAVWDSPLEYKVLLYNLIPLAMNFLLAYFSPKFHFTQIHKQMFATLYLSGGRLPITATH